MISLTDKMEMDGVDKLKALFRARELTIARQYLAFLEAGHTGDELVIVQHPDFSVRLTLKKDLKK